MVTMTTKNADTDSTPREAQDQYSEAETVARREAVLKRMLATPPKPHKEMARQSKGRPAKKQKPKAS